MLGNLQQTTRYPIDDLYLGANHGSKVNLPIWDGLYKAGHWARYVTQFATYVAAVVGHDLLHSQPRMSLL